MKLSEAIAQARLSRGHDPAEVRQWRDLVGDPLSGEIDAVTARVIAFGPLEIAGVLLPFLEGELEALVHTSEAEPRPKVGEISALVKLYLSLRETGLPKLEPGF